MEGNWGSWAKWNCYKVYIIKQTPLAIVRIVADDFWDVWEGRKNKGKIHLTYFNKSAQPLDYKDNY